MASCVSLSLDGMFSTFPVEGGTRLVHDNDSEKRLYLLADRSLGKLNEDEDSFGEIVIDLLFLGRVLASLVLSLHPLPKEKSCGFPKPWRKSPFFKFSLTERDTYILLES